jgi:predicted MFS family arabinose efflux permease
MNRLAASLDTLNFFLADVRYGLGPYLAIYLLTVQHWDAASIGVVMSISGIAGLVAQTPAGALIDVTRTKRALIVGAALLVTAGSLLLPVFPQFASVAALQVITGSSAAIFAPAIAALTLGIVGPMAFSRRVGRNEAFNHAGNATAAVIAGSTSYFFGPIAVFWVLATMAAGSIVAVLSIPKNAIDHEIARGLTAEQERKHEQPSGFRVLLECRPLLVFAACVTMFHFANAAMLPLVGQKLALADRNLGTPLMSVCIIAAQIVMVPMAMLVGATADSWGRKPLFLAGFAVLTVRGLLYPLSDDPYWPLGVQLMDGSPIPMLRGRSAPL